MPGTNEAGKAGHRLYEVHSLDEISIVDTEPRATHLMWRYHAHDVFKSGEVTPSSHVVDIIGMRNILKTHQSDLARGGLRVSFMESA